VEERKLDLKQKSGMSLGKGIKKGYRKNRYIRVGHERATEAAGWMEEKDGRV